jgi:3-hydroxyisobutyrate dehydrogenase-like beta-hydroxyacid dehydrogenase
MSLPRAAVPGGRQLPVRPKYARGMTTVGIVSPGAMGSAIGSVHRRGGCRVVTTVTGRSERTRRLAEVAELDLLPGLNDVVETADVVLSIVPPGEALVVARDLARAATECGAHPLVADLNAVAPATAHAIAGELATAGLELVDGSISGPPPTHAGTTRVYLSGGRAGEIAALPAPGLERRVVGVEIGLASAVKMCTASVYKGRVALHAHALLAALELGVLEHVLDDLRETMPVERLNVTLARAATKAHRYVPEMREIAAAQAAAGLTPALFEAMAEVWEQLSRGELAGHAPEDVDGSLALEDVLARLRS